MSERITITEETQVRRPKPNSSIGSTGDAYDWVASDGRRFWASEAFVVFGGQEILVFKQGDDDNVSDWIEVAGGRGFTFAEAKNELVEYLNETNNE